MKQEVVTQWSVIYWEWGYSKAVCNAADLADGQVKSISALGTAARTDWRNMNWENG